MALEHNFAERGPAAARIQANWGARLFFATLLVVLVFFWWLLIYSGGVGGHRG